MFKGKFMRPEKEIKQTIIDDFFLSEFPPFKETSTIALSKFEEDFNKFTGLTGLKKTTKLFDEFEEEVLNIENILTLINDLSNFSTIFNEIKKTFPELKDEKLETKEDLEKLLNNETYKNGVIQQIQLSVIEELFDVEELFEKLKEDIPGLNDKTIKNKDDFKNIFKNAEFTKVIISKITGYCNEAQLSLKQSPEFSEFTQISMRTFKIKEQTIDPQNPSYDKAKNMEQLKKEVDDVTEALYENNPFIKRKALSSDFPLEMQKNVTFLLTDTFDTSLERVLKYLY